MSQARNKKKFRMAGSSACPAAVDARWSQIRRFGSTPKKEDSILSPNNVKFGDFFDFFYIFEPCQLITDIADYSLLYPGAI